MREETNTKRRAIVSFGKVAQTWLNHGFTEAKHLRQAQRCVLDEAKGHILMTNISSIVCGNKCVDKGKRTLE